MAGFRKKKPEQAALKYAFYGKAGSGKSLTALLIAEGLARVEGKKIAYVDTEHGTDFYAQPVPERRVHPEAFEFDALDTRSLTESIAEIRKLNPNEYGVVVIDSITHLWEAAQNAYSGKKIGKSQDKIPIHAWGAIKRPYKSDLVGYLINSPMHVIICGREGVEFGKGDDGEMEATGVKMKAEGETAYEPHILIRMMPDKDKHGNCVYRAFAEKDRTGILGGRMIPWPNFDNLCAPLLGLLGKTQAQISSDDETAMHDAESLAEAEAKKRKESTEAREHFEAHFKLSKTLDELKTVGKTLTPAIKKGMVTADVAALRDAYHAREAQLSGQVVMVPDDSEEAA